MSTQQTFVIVGAGLAGAKAAEALRTNGFGGKVILIGDEAERPYDRPPLSKGYLLGTTEREKIYIHPAQWHPNTTSTCVWEHGLPKSTAHAHEVNTARGETIGYDKLLLATGSSPRRLTVPGADLAGVHYLRRVADSEALQAAFASAQRVAIIGAGWIGLETAAAARAAGCHVTLIERAKLPLAGRPRRGGGRNLRRPAPRTRCRAAAERRRDRNHRRGRQGDRRAPGRRRRRGGRRGRGRRGHHAPTPSWPPRQACRSTTASSSMSTWPPPTPTYSRPGMSPTPTTRCWAPTCASSTGRLPSTRARSRRPT